MARHRRRARRGTLNHPATAFAGKVAGGRSIQWESLAVAYDMNALTAQYPTVSVTAAGLTTRFRTLIPVNVLGGPVTMLRVRGNVLTSFQEGDIAAAGGQAKVGVAMSIQLVPVRDGAIVDDSILDMRNAADLESNRILWRDTAWVDGNISDGGGAGILVNAVRVYMTRLVIDIKVKRRWDRASWALVMAETYNSVAEAAVNQSIEMRALFQTADGI